MEVAVALANVTGKDVYINIPSNASLAYINNLANLFAFGSDGVNPYTSVTTNPVWAPLDSNLKVYIEYSNEIWNFGFSQAGTGGSGWINQLSQRAVYDYETNNQNDPLYPGGGANAYNDGAIIASQYITGSNLAAWEATYNGTNPTEVGYESPSYFSNNDSALTGYTIYQGWVALRLGQISTAFKTAFSETGINADATASRVRPLFEWQYGGGWSGELSEIKSIFGSQHPVGYYLYGGGGGWYSDDTYGGFNDTVFTNGNFATPTVSGYQAGPTGSSWTFNGSAGIAANGSSLGNLTAPTDGPTNNPTGSGQTAYLTPGASISQSVTFSAGYANITLLAEQTLASNSSYGMSITVSGNGVNLTMKEEEGSALFSGNNTAWTWSRTAAFNVPAGTYTVTFTNTWKTGGATVFVDNLGIETVNGLFSQTAASGAPVPGTLDNGTSSVKADVALCLQYGLYDVGYEGGFDFNENLGNDDVNGYADIGARGYSSGTANVAEEANLDPRTIPLSQGTIDQFYQAGGTLPVVFTSFGNPNSWGVAAPTNFDWNTPKLQGAQATEQALPPSVNYGTNIPGTLSSTNISQNLNGNGGVLSTNGWVAWDINVPEPGTYTFTATTTTGGNYSFSIDGINIFGTGASGGTIDPTVALSPGLYSFAVTATSGAFTVSQVVVSQVGAPSAPTILSGSLSGSVANLSWTAVASATGYIIGYGTSTGNYTSFIDEGNATTGTITGLNASGVTYVAVYAYNASSERSLPSAQDRLAPRSTNATSLITFEDQTDTASSSWVTEPFLDGGLSFTSNGNSGGQALQVQDGTAASAAPGGWPSKVLESKYWGSGIIVSGSGGSAFDLYSLDVGESSVAVSAVLTGTDASGGTDTYIVTFPSDTQPHVQHVVLDWVDIIKMQVSFWTLAGGGGTEHDGSIDNLLVDDAPPTIANPATASSTTVTSTSTNLSALAADHSGTSGLIYTWAATTLPAGVAAPIFSNNATNTAQNTTAYFTAAGNYVLTVTIADSYGVTTSSTVPISVTQTLTGLTITPASSTVADGATQALSAAITDQFGAAMGTQPGAFTWSLLTTGTGTVTASGTYTAPATGTGWATVDASGGGYTGTAAVYYTPAASLVPNYYAGFPTTAGLTLNGGANISGNALQLTDTSSISEIHSVYYSTKLSTSNFVTDFGFQVVNPINDGFTFVIQNKAVTALSTGGGGQLGYQSITPSVALKFQLLDTNDVNNVGVFTDGASPTTIGDPLGVAGLSLLAGDIFHAHLVYNASTLTLSLTDTSRANDPTVTDTFAVNIASVVGSSTAWFGFTASSGGVSSATVGMAQDILWWTFGQPIVSVTPVNPNVSSSPVNSLTINSTRPLFGLNNSTFSLMQNSQPIVFGSAPLIGTGDGGLVYLVSNLASLTGGLGNYTFTVNAAGVSDAAGNAAAANASASWVSSTLTAPANAMITIAGEAGSIATVTVNGGTPYNVSLSSFSTISIDGSAGNDSLQLDFTNGSPIPSGGLTFTGGMADSLTVTGTSGNDTATIGGSQLIFDGSTISLPNVPTLTLNTGAGDDLLTQTSQPTAAAVTFNGGTGSDQLIVSAGTYTFSVDPQPLTSNLAVVATGAETQLLFNPLLSQQVHLAGLTLTGGAVATLVSLGNLRTAVNHRSLVIGTAGATSSPAFSIDANSVLNLTDNDLIIHGGNMLTAVDSLLGSGYAGGYWNGVGINSSVAAASTLTTLGAINPAGATAFDNESVGTSDTIIKYTYYGDANLDGQVDGSDYSRIDNAVLNQLTGWYNGDFNNDGVINGSDYTLLDNAYNTQATPLVEIASAKAVLHSSYVPQAIGDNSDLLGTLRHKRSLFSRQQLLLPAVN